LPLLKINGAPQFRGLQIFASRLNLKAHDGNRTRDLFLTKEVLYRLSYMGKIYVHSPVISNSPRRAEPIHGAGDGIRTRDPELGRLALYQLSYSRPYVPAPHRPRFRPHYLVERGGFEPP
jgi:hypothetical protein